MKWAKKAKTISFMTSVQVFLREMLGTWYGPVGT